jgi:hypothetical protein
VVEHSIGNGEVDSSILSGSTIPFPRKKPFICSANPQFRASWHDLVRIGHFSYFSQNEW